MKMYIWTKDVLTQYSDGIAVAVAEDIDSARKMILDKHWKEQVVPNVMGGETSEDWPVYEYEKLKTALYMDPDIQDIPYAVYKHGGA